MQTTSEEEVKASASIPSSTSPTQNMASADTIRGRRIMIRFAAATLFASFFLPWTSIMGANISGLDIQKNVDSYKLVWLMPAGALATLLLSITNGPTGLIRRVAGIVPFGILAYTLNQLGSEAWRIFSFGAWLALLSGLALILIPGIHQPQPKG